MVDYLFDRDSVIRAIFNSRIERISFEIKLALRGEPHFPDGNRIHLSVS